MSIVQSGLPLALLTPFALAAWIAFLHPNRAASRPPASDCDAHPFDLFMVPPTVDLATALRDAADAVDMVAYSRAVQIELAVGAAMMVPVDSNALSMALRDVMLSAINATPGGKVLVTAATRGDQLHIRIIDDSPNTNQQARETSMRQTDALIALQGGSISVEARSGRGTTVTIRLPMRASSEQEANGSRQLPVLADHDA